MAGGPCPWKIRIDNQLFCDAEKEYVNPRSLKKIRPKCQMLETQKSDVKLQDLCVWGVIPWR